MLDLLSFISGSKGKQIERFSGSKSWYKKLWIGVNNVKNVPTNALTAVGALMTLIDFTLTPDDFTRQWGTPWQWKG